MLSIITGTSDRANLSAELQAREVFRTLAHDKVQPSELLALFRDERVAAVAVRLRIDNTITFSVSILPAKIRNVGRSDARGRTAKARGDIVGDGGDLSVGI